MTNKEKKSFCPPENNPFTVKYSKCSVPERSLAAVCTLQMFTSTVRLQYKFKVVKYTNDICIPLTVVQGTAIIAQRYNQPFQYS